MKLLFSFKGKIRRGKFFGLGLLYLIIYLLIIVYTPVVIDVLATLIYIIINFTLAVKRLYDIRYSPWLVLLYIVPVAGVVLYFMLLFINGREGNEMVKKVENAAIQYVGIPSKSTVASLSEIQSNVFKILDDSVS